MSKDDSWLIEFASFLKEKWIVQKPNLILGGSAIGLIYDVYTWILIWNCYRFTSAVHWWIYYKWICCEWWLLFYATAAVTADDETGNANSEPFESTTLLSPFFSRDFWILHFILPLGLELSSKWGQNPHLIRLVFLMFRYMHFCFGITSRERDWWLHAVNIGFYPLGKTTSVHYSLYYSLSFFRRHASGAAAALVCEWMDTCLKVNHDFKKLSVYKCLGCCNNLKCLKMTLLVSKDRIGEGGY